MSGLVPVNGNITCQNGNLSTPLISRIHNYKQMQSVAKLTSISRSYIPVQNNLSSQVPHPGPRRTIIPGTQKDSLPSSRITGATAIFFIRGIYGCSNQYAFLSSISLHLHDSHLPCKLEVNKIAARWPAKAVAQFFTFSKKGSDRIGPR